MPLEIGRHHGLELVSSKHGGNNRPQRNIGVLVAIQMADNAAGNVERILVVFGIVIGHTRQPRMHIRSTQIFGGHHLACCRLDQRWTTEKNCALMTHDDRFIRHCRHIGPTCRARAHHDRDLGNAHRRHGRLIEENTAEMIAVRKNLGLVGQIRTTRIHKIQAWQTVLTGNFLGAKMLFNSHRVICAAFDGGVVAHDHHFTTRHPPDSGNQPRAVDGTIILTISSQPAQFQKRRAGIKQPRHPFAGQ